MRRPKPSAEEWRCEWACVPVQGKLWGVPAGKDFTRSLGAHSGMTVLSPIAVVTPPQISSSPSPLPSVDLGQTLLPSRLGRGFSFLNPSLHEGVMTHRAQRKGWLSGETSSGFFRFSAHFDV